MCYFYLAVNLFSMVFYTIFDADQILQYFFAIVFICTFAPDFKPKVFISFTILCYLTIIVLLVYNHHSLELGGYQTFALNIFLYAFVMKILFYNNKVKIFTNIFRIEALSITDELTKLNNRRSLMNYMDIIWKQSRRMQFPITIIMIDIDFYKKYNDSMGHLEGDNALIAVAQCLRNQLKRETDFVARFGGEEFVCLLPYIEKTEAVSFAKELVQSVENMEIPHPMSEHSKYVTISAGMSSIVPTENNSQIELLGEADKALYMAKQSGRNRVIAN
jgi:diguanylate cyclase (GGDEF)-like protein